MNLEMAVDWWVPFCCSLLQRCVAEMCCSVLLQCAVLQSIANAFETGPLTCGYTLLQCVAVFFCSMVL